MLRFRQPGYPRLGRSLTLWCLVFTIALVYFPGRASSAADIAPLANAAPLIRNFAPDELGSGSKVRCLVEAPDGTLFAGSDRLLIYNGVRWSQARIENTSEIHALCVQGKRLWAGGVNEVGYFEESPDGSYEYTSATARLGGDFYGAVNAIVSVGEDVVIVTERKVVLLAGKEGAPRIWELPNDRRLKAFQYNGVVYINQRSADGGKGWALRKGSLEPDSTFVGLDGQLRHPVGIRGRRLVLASGYNLVERDLDTGEERAFYSDDGGMRKAALSGSTTLLNGVVYACSFYRGLMIVEPNGHVTTVGKAEGLPSDMCVVTSASQMNGVWVATDEGISFVHDITKARVFTPAGLVVSFAGDASDLLVGTQTASYRYQASGCTEVPIPRGTFARLGDDIFVVASGRIHHSDAKSFNFQDWGEIWGGSGGAVIGSRSDRNALLLMTNRGLSRVNVETKTVTNVEIQEKPHYFVQDRKNRVWVSTASGKVMVMDEHLQKGTVQFSSRRRANLALHDGEALVLYDDVGFIDAEGRPILGTERLVNGRGTETVEGPGWLFGRIDGTSMVGVVAKGPRGLEWHRKNVPGLKRLKHANVLHKSGDMLWIGGDTGFIQVDTTRLEDPVLTLPEIASVEVRSSRRGSSRAVETASQHLELTNIENEFTIRYKTRVWGVLEPPEYESRLLPVEKDWTPHQYGDAVNRRNLPTGRYTLELRARHLGEAGPVVAYQVWRRPPWYFSYVGVTCMALIACGAFYGAVRLRTRQVLARNRELEEKIRDRTRELAKANAAKSEFLAAMSHEIRNPMNGVIGITKILQEAKLGAREKYYLTTLHRCAEQLRTTVDDVLDFSKIEAGEITLHPDTFDLADTLKATITAADLTGERLELTSWAGPRPTVTGDQGKFCQILTNYFSNALKYGVPPRATIDVYVLSDGDDHCRVTVAVKNCGPDLPPEELSTLFESFTRGEYAKRRRIGGSGLGLSICKRYAEAMGGKVTATSSGGITVFQVSVPFEVAQARAAAPGESLVPPKLHARALAIEDEDYNRLVLGSILSKLGYHVDWACDGKTARQLAEQNGYDLILTDWLLPDTDGGTLTREILSLCEEPKPPVFAVTAYSTREKEEECRSAGMAGFISKPITVEKLEAALQAWASSRKGFIPAAPPVVETVTPVSLVQLSRLGPIETVLPDFVEKLRTDWAEVDLLLEKCECTRAANNAHRLISAVLLVDAGGAADQLRVLESRLRDGALESDIEKVRVICREEIARVADALLAAQQRRQRLNEARLPT